MSILIFLMAYSSVKIKRPKNFSTIKYVFSIIGIYLLSGLIMIPISIAFSNIKTPEVYNYSPTVMDSISSIIFLILPWIIDYYISKLLLKSYKDNLDAQTPQFSPEEKAEMEKAIKKYNKKRLDKESTDDTSAENIDPGVQDTTAEVEAAYFELKKEVQKKLEELNKKYGTMKNVEKNSEAKKITLSSIIPEDIAINKNDLPYVKNREYGYGRRFNAFVTKYSDCYHKSKCPSIRFHKKILMHRYEAMKKYRPCSFCNPINYVDCWYKVYLDNKNIIDNDTKTNNINNKQYSDKSISEDNLLLIGIISIGIGVLTILIYACTTS